MNNEMKPTRGLWRLRDTDGDDQFDKAELLRKIAGQRRARPARHRARAGRQVDLFRQRQSHQAAGEPRTTRARSRGTKTICSRGCGTRTATRRASSRPAATSAKPIPRARRVELFACGFRNHSTSPSTRTASSSPTTPTWSGTWARRGTCPTRINHAVSGGDYGWRTGAGRWPELLRRLPARRGGHRPRLADGHGLRHGREISGEISARALRARLDLRRRCTRSTSRPTARASRRRRRSSSRAKPLPLTDVIVQPRGRRDVLHHRRPAQRSRRSIA